MNEELKIIIKTVADQTHKELEGVKKELEAIQKKSEDVGKTEKAIQGLGKTAKVAAAGIAAVATAIVALGKSSLEIQKAQGRLESGFKNAGSSAEQAQKTFTDLFRFLGEADTATEAANLLARLTTSEQDLAEWTTILQGVYATFPDSLPVESLAEAANETAKVGTVTGSLADALNWVGVSEDAFNAKLEALNSTAEREALIRQTLLGLYGNAAVLYERNNAGMLAYNEAQARLNQQLAQSGKYVTPLLTALSNMAATLLQVLTPAIQMVSNVLTVLVQWISAAARAISSFFGGSTQAAQETTSTVGGLSSNISQATSGVGGLNKGFKDAAKQAEKLKRATMGFDELNVVSKPTKTPSASSAGAGGVGGIGGGSIPAISIPSFSMSDLGLGGITTDLKEVEERMKGVLVLVGLIAAGILAWKIINAVKDIETFKTALTGIAGKFLIIAGALVMVQGYSDAWATGVDWGNLAMVIGGAAAAIGGLYLTLGPLAAAIGIVVAGVAGLVLGVKDFINNGPTLQNTILIIGGAIAVAVGLATAGLSVLVAAIVAAVAAIAAFVAAIILEQPAIMSVEEAQENLTAAKQKAAEAEMGYINAIDAAENAMKRLENAEKAAGMSGEELFQQVQDGTIDYANMTDAQKELYKAYLDNEKKQKEVEKATEELTAAKKAEKIASYENQLALAKESGNYDDFKKSVVEAFQNGELSAAEARDLIAKSMSEMSDASQKTFMEDLPSDLKNGLDPHQYESTGTKIKKWFSNLWTDIKKVFSDAAKFVAEAVSSAFKKALNWVLERAISIINGFIGAINTAISVINAIPGVSISKLKKLDVPKLAKGGIVDSATLAMVGERGKEAVVPLENNTEWMDKLAERISLRNNTPSKIVLMLDSKELGWANINSINNITKQTGQLQLALV